MRKLTLLTLLAMPCALAAQEPSALDSVQNIQEVVVRGARITAPNTVVKIPAPRREIPLTTNILPLEKIRLLGYSDPAQAMQTLPGVHAFKDYGGFHMFFLRGFYESVVLSDGMRDERHALWQSAPLTGMAAVSHIEVLKGAASMSVGHSALGGVINIINKQPKAKKAFDASYTVGSWATHRITAGGTGAISSKANARADVEYSTSDGWRGNYTKTANAHAAIDIALAPKHRLSFALIASNDFFRGDYGQPHLKWDVYDASTDKLAYRQGDFPSSEPASRAYTDPNEFLTNKTVKLHGKYSYAINDRWRLSEHAFFAYDSLNYYSTDGLNYLTGDKAVGAKHYYLDGNKKVPVLIDRVQRDGFGFAYGTLTAQNQLELTGRARWGNTKHALLAAYNFSYLNLRRSDRALYTGAGVGSIVTLKDPVLDQGPIYMKYRRMQIFNDLVNSLSVQDFMTWQKLNLLAGVRLDFFSRDYGIYNTDDFKLLDRTLDQRQTNTAFTYRLGAVYNVTKYFNVYSSLSSFFKPQRITLSPEVVYMHPDGREMSDSELRSFKPLTGRQWEVGLHLDLGTELSLSAAAYHITLNNMVRTNLGTAADGRKIGGPIGKSVSKGIELEMRYAPSTAFDFSLGYSLTDARIAEYTSSKFVKNVTAGNRLKRVPLDKLSAWGFYNIGLGRKGEAFRLGFGTEHSGSFYSDETNIFKVPGYTIFHAVASLNVSKALRLQLNVNNLFDAVYHRATINSTQYIPAEGRNLQFTTSLAL